MDIQRVAVYVPIKDTHLVKFVPAYEVPLLREVSKQFAKNQEEYRKFGVKNEFSREERGVFSSAEVGTELERCKKTYHRAFPRVYPTDNDFEVAFAKCAAEHGIKGDKGDTGGTLVRRERLPIEDIDGIGPAFADEVAALLGDGEVATLAKAQSYILAGIAGVTSDKAEEFIVAAKEIAGIKDELTIAEPEPLPKSKK